MHGRMLPKYFGIDARVLNLVGRDTRPLVAGDIANAIAAGLHRMQVRLGQDREHLGHVVELDPVELNILTCGEMAVAAVIAPRNMRQRAHLVG